MADPAAVKDFLGTFNGTEDAPPPSIHADITRWTNYRSIRLRWWGESEA